MNLLIKKFLSRSIVRFAAVGAVSTTADLLVFTQLEKIMRVSFAATIGFLVGLSVGFILNSLLVFKVEKSAKRYSKYFLVSFGGLILTLLIIQLILRLGISTNELFAKLVAVVVVFFWNYGWSKAWAFR